MRKLVRLILLRCCDSEESSNDEKMSENGVIKENNFKQNDEEIENNGNFQCGERVKQWIESNLPAPTSHEIKNQLTRRNSVPSLNIEIQQQSRKMSCLEKFAYKQLTQDLDENNIFTNSELTVQTQHLKRISIISGEKLNGNEKQVLRRVLLLSKD